LSVSDNCPRGSGVRRGVPDPLVARPRHLAGSGASNQGVEVYPLVPAKGSLRALGSHRSATGSATGPARRAL